MKDFLLPLLYSAITVLVMAYLIIIFIAMGLGFMDSSFAQSRCFKEPIKMEMFFPTYRLGCWLGQEDK